MSKVDISGYIVPWSLPIPRENLENFSSKPVVRNSLGRHGLSSQLTAYDFLFIKYFAFAVVQKAVRNVNPKVFFLAQV